VTAEPPRLNQPILLDRGLQFLDRLIVEIDARLEPIGLDAVYVDIFERKFCSYWSV
jgi:hypothetical protein